MDETTTFRAPKYSAPLSARERMLLAGWERSRVQRVTRADLVRQFGPSRASDVTKGLVRKGVLRRVGRGVFLVVPMRAQTRPTVSSAAVEAAALLCEEPYYLGGLWALSFHRLTTQQFASRLDAFITRRSRPRRLSSAELWFHVVSAEAVAAGVISTELEHTTVNVSSPERTVLDVLDYPHAAGGVPAAVRLVNDALDKLDRRRLVQLAATGSQVSSCQRLGVLLERLGASSTQLRPLHRRVAETRSVISMLPGTSRRGRVSLRWRVVENDLLRMPLRAE